MPKIHPLPFAIGLVVTLAASLAVFAIPMPELGLRAALGCSLFFAGGALTLLVGTR